MIAAEQVYVDGWQMNNADLVGATAVQESTEILEREFRAWSNKKRLMYDLTSMIGTFGLSLGAVSAVSSMSEIDAVYVKAMRAMGVLSAATILLIFFKESFFYTCRDFVMSAMWYLLTLAVLNYFPLLQLALLKTSMLRAFVSICCNRVIGILMASMAWRVPISWAPSVSFAVIFISARGAVRASRLYGENDPGNPYVDFVCGRLNFGITAVCRAFSTWGGLLADGVEIFLPCDKLKATPGDTVLLIWLIAHMSGFWCGFLLTLRDEVADRKAFCVATRRNPSLLLHADSVKLMMLQMLGVQLFGMTSLLFLGNGA